MRRQNCKHTNIKNMQKHRENIQKHRVGGVVIFVLLALSFCRYSMPVYAQIGVPPTPLPQVIATRQAADSKQNIVDDLQAQRAEIQRRLYEINANIDNQIKEAEAATADAKVASATQNAVEAGAAIGRLEGAIAQLKDSYAGKDTIIADLQARNEQQAAQIITDTRTIDNLTAQLQQAKSEKQTAINAYTALSETKKQNQQNDMVSNAIWLIVALAFLLAMIALAAFVLQRRRAVVIEPPDNGEVVEGEVINAEDESIGK